MHIGIIFAMQEELDAFKQLFDTFIDKKLFHHHLTVIKTDNHTYYCMLSGIGKTQAASATTLLLAHKPIDYLFNSGVAGGIDIEHASIVIADATLYHDVNVHAFGYEIGQMPNQPLLFEADPSLLKIAKDVCEDSDTICHSGLIASGDQFMVSLDPLKTFLTNHPTIKAIEMESASIAHVAKNFNVKHLILRSISDVIGDDTQSVDFKTFVNEASLKSAMLLRDIIKKL